MQSDLFATRFERNCKFRNPAFFADSGRLCLKSEQGTEVSARVLLSSAVESGFGGRTARPYVTNLTVASSGEKANEDNDEPG